MSDKEEIKKCPFCAEDIKKDAVKCKHCGEYLMEKQPQEIIEKGKVKCPFCDSIIIPQKKQATGSGCLIAIILLIFFVVPGIIYIVWDSSRKQCPKCKMILGSA